MKLTTQQLAEMREWLNDKYAEPDHTRGRINCNALLDHITALEVEMEAVEKALKSAKCPNDCKDGYSDIAYDDNLHIDHFSSTECEWCKRRGALLKQEQE